MGPTIRIDDEIYTWLQQQGRAFEDTPSIVLLMVSASSAENVRFAKREICPEISPLFKKRGPLTVS